GAREFSFADLKGDLDAVGALSGGFEWQQGGADSLHPAQRGRVSLDGNELRSARLLARPISDQLEVPQDVYLADIALGAFFCKYYGVKNARRYRPLPRFPAVERDFSLLLDDGVTFAEVSEIIRGANIPELASIEAADLFRGKNVPAGKYSLMLRGTFHGRETTLTDAEAADSAARIVAALESRLGAALRAS